MAASGEALSNFNGAAADLWRVPRRGNDNAMLDVILIAVGIGFFAVAILYVGACERL